MRNWFGGTTLVIVGVVVLVLVINKDALCAGSASIAAQWNLGGGQ